MIKKIEKDLTVYKPDEQNITFWIIHMFNYVSQQYESPKAVNYGTIVSYFLSKVIDINLYDLSKDIFDFLEEENMLKSDEELYSSFVKESQDLIKCINSRQNLDNIERYKVYSKWKCFAYVLTFRDLYDDTVLDSLLQFDNLSCPIEISDSYEIVRKGVTIDGIPCSEIKLYEFYQLFMLDLWEILFNKFVKTKYLICKNKLCECCFETNDLRIKYCPECRSKKNENHTIKLSDKITKLIKKIHDSYSVRMDTAISNSKRRDIDELKKEALIKEYKGLVFEHESFIREIRYYKNRIAGKIVEPNKLYDNSIDNEERFYNWLIKYIKAKGFKIRIDENGKTNEKSEWDRSDS